METNKKSKILVQLSQSKGRNAIDALKVEGSKSSELLLNENDYVTLSHTLEELEIYAFRVPDLVVDACRRFLHRLEVEEIEFTFGGSEVRQVRDAVRLPITLMSETLKLLGTIRYYAMADVIDIALPLANCDDSSVQRTATDILSQCAKFDLDLYYGGEDYRGVGATPQFEILEALEKSKVDYLLENIGGFITLLRQLLSPDMGGSDWDYDKVTLKFAAVPVGEDILEIRDRSLALLYKAYHKADSVGAKQSLLGTLYTAASAPSHGELTSELSELIAKNVIEILEFIKSVIVNEKMPIIQKIEHDTFWLYYHAVSEDVKSSALEIRDLINANEEYSIYKNLIGFEGIFEDWEQDRKDRLDYSEIDKSRSEKAEEYVLSIDEENWSAWRRRILEYAQTQSEDLATFPRFYDFLEKLASKQPEMMFELIENDLDSIRGFTIPIYRGLWQSSLKDDCKNVLLTYIAKGRQLYPAAKMFLSINELDHDVLGSVIDEAIRTKDVRVLTELIGVACTRYDNDNQYTVEEIFRPVLNCLNELGSVHWVQSIWFNKEARKLVSELAAEDRKLVFVSLLQVDEISYQAEEILIPMAVIDPESVIDFFGTRIKYGKERTGYSAIPFQFHKLNEVLSKHTELLVEKVRSWYDDDPLFQYKGGKFLAEIYPNFSDELEQCLVKLIQQGDDEDLRFVIAAIRNYDGDTFLHNVCREILLKKPDSEKIKRALRLVLLSTGVVSGEYGHAEAYERKAQEMEGWLRDSDKGIARFAAEFIDILLAAAKAERERADEEIALRKHRFGHKP